VTVWDPKNRQEIYLLTDLLDVPAYVVGAIYRRRWQIELFFRWLKLWAAWDHALSFSRTGITLPFYVAVIAGLLMHVRSGRKVNKYMLFLMGQVAGGTGPLRADRADAGANRARKAVGACPTGPKEGREKQGLNGPAPFRVTRPGLGRCAVPDAGPRATGPGLPPRPGHTPTLRVSPVKGLQCHGQY
jgi:hypothetical protein